MKFLQIFLTLVFFFFSIVSASGQISVTQNHPELNWQIFETEHVKIIYHQGIDTIAVQVARIAEQVYPSITDDLGTEPPGKTPIIVSDYEDYSNGLATPLGHYIFLWTQSFPKYTTGDIHWLQGLVAHEFTHMVNFWAFRGFPGFWRELLALGFVPTWFLEGLAEYEAEKWCDHRDMLLRVVSYRQKMLPYKKMTGYIGADQIDARLLYEQGHSIVRYISFRFGHEKLKEIIEKYRAFPLSFNLALKRSIGLSETELFEQWKQEVDAFYYGKFQNKTPVDQVGKILTTPFQGNYAARWSPDGNMIAIVGIKKYDEGVRDLYLYHQQTKKFKKVAGPNVNSFFSWSPDDKKIVYSQKHRVKTGSEVNDLFLLDVKSLNIKRITNDEHANDPHFSPDGKKIVYTVHQITHSDLAILDLTTGDSKIITEFPNWTEVFTAQFSPDGKHIVFSIFDNLGNRDICLVETDGSNFKYLTTDPEDDRYPAWSPDGQKIAFISYRNHFPNLYILELATNNLSQISDTPGGVFNPAWLPDGKQVAVISFEKRDKTEIVILPAQGQTAIDSSPDKKNTLPFHSVQQPVFLQPDSPLHKLDKITKNKPYHSFSNIRSQILLPYLSQDETGWQPGILNLFADPLAKQTLMTTFSYRARPHFSVDYTNQQFSPTIQLYLNKTTINHGDFLIIDKNTTLPLYENYWIGSLTLQWNINFGRSLLSNHLFWLRQMFTYRDAINYVDYEKNNIANWARPFQGWINYLTLGYMIYTYRPDVFYDIHPKSGYVFSIYSYHASRFMNSDLTFTQLNGYAVLRRELPFKQHVFALKISGLFRKGDAPLQGRLGFNNLTIRGLGYSRYGDRQLFSNLEYRMPLIRDLGLKFWILYFEQFTGALFLDSGKAWGAYWRTFDDGSKTSFSDVDWVHTAGGELRHRFYLLGKIAVVICCGYGFNLSDFGEANFYIRLGSVF